MAFKANPQQEAFITAPVEGAIRVFAGPGAGKTASMSQRIAFLLKNGVDPDQILCVTYGRDMADEMGKRVLSISPQANIRQICTIHAANLRMLRAEGMANGDVAKPSEEKFNAKEALERTAITEVGYKEFLVYVNAAKFNAVRHYNLQSFYQNLIDANGGITKYVPWKHRAAELLASATVEYDKIMREKKVMTFSDMMCEVEWMLEDRPEILAKYQALYGWIMVDEGQDTSKQAMRILTKLAAPQDNFTVIGDTDQTIFGFAGASPESNMWGGFEQRFPNATTFKLETNYRSTAKIVEFTNKAILANYNEDTEKYRKTLIPREEAPEGVETTYEVYPAIPEEANAVATGIYDEMFDDGYKPGDFYVLSRTRAQLAYLYGGLFKLKIPFIDKTGGNFFDSAHIQDMLAYLKLSINLDDEESFARIYNKASVNMKQPFDLTDRKTNKLIRARGAYVNHRWLGKEFLSACGGSWFGIGDAIRKNGRWADGASDMRWLMSEIQKAETPVSKLEAIADQCLRRWWASEEGEVEDGQDGSGRADDFNVIIDLAKQYESLADFFEYIEELQALARDAKAGDESKMVVLSTIHRVKGQERKVIYTIGVMDGLLPHKAALGEMPKPDSVLPFSNKTTLDDERRLFFVAVSRAIERVHLTGAYLYQNKKLTKSRFCHETGLAKEEAIESELVKLLTPPDLSKAKLIAIDPEIQQDMEDAEAYNKLVDDIMADESGTKLKALEELTKNFKKNLSSAVQDAIDKPEDEPLNESFREDTEGDAFFGNYQDPADLPF